MTTPAPALDIVTVAIAVATALFGAAAGQYVGAYFVIFLGAVLGSAWSASRRQPGSRLGTFSYMVLMVIFALLVTVPLAELAARRIGEDSRWFLGPIAVIVGGVGEKWSDILLWLWGLVRGRLERIFGGERRAEEKSPGGET